MVDPSQNPTVHAPNPANGGMDMETAQRLSELPTRYCSLSLFLQYLTLGFLGEEQVETCIPVVTSSKMTDFLLSRFKLPMDFQSMLDFYSSAFAYKALRYNIFITWTYGMLFLFTPLTFRQSATIYFYLLHFTSFSVAGLFEDELAKHPEGLFAVDLVKDSHFSIGVPLRRPAESRLARPASGAFASSAVATALTGLFMWHSAPSLSYSVGFEDHDFKGKQAYTHNPDIKFVLQNYSWHAR